MTHSFVSGENEIMLASSSSTWSSAATPLPALVLIAAVAGAERGRGGGKAPGREEGVGFVKRPRECIMSMRALLSREMRGAEWAALMIGAYLRRA